jgi:glyoxylase-like metal-dependent hydrolase (beta-lactamase superfamily II)
MALQSLGKQEKDGNSGPSKNLKPINPMTTRLASARTVLILTGLLLLTLSEAGNAQGPQPDGAGVRTGVLPSSWVLGGPKCVEIPQFQIHEYNEDLYIIRESGCANYEKPFLYLLFGKDKALLLDTGAGKTEVSRYVGTVIDSWLRRNKRESIPLVVAHTHAHRDHTSGDQQLAALPGATLVKPEVKAVQDFFAITSWPDQIAQYDLGGRILDVIPIPGHEKSSIAVYDRQTGILFTGDTLYPGRLYVDDSDAFVRSIARLVDFTRGKVVAHILGAHIENTRTPYLDYRIGTIYQPEEHVLELSRGHLLELDDALRQMNGKVIRMAMRDFTVWPK